MDTALLVAKLFLAAVFGVAGVAKLADLPGSRRAVIGFGLPERLAPAFGLLLPLLELAVAVALLTTIGAFWGAVGALALLLLFVVAIGVNMALGRNPDCHCFGQLHSAPAGPKTLIRNAVFSIPAAFVVLQGPTGAGPGVLGWLATLGPVERLVAVVGGIALVVLAVEAWFLMMLLRQNGRLMVRLEELEARVAGLGDLSDDELDEASGFTHTPGAAHGPPGQAGLPIGTPAPKFRLPGLHGETLSLEALLAAEKPVLLMFMDPNCGPCNSLMPDVGRWQREEADRLTVAVVSRGSAKANSPKADEHGLQNVVLQKNYEVAESFEVHGTPGAVIVQPDGTIGSPAALGPIGIQRLVARALGQPIPGAAQANGHAHDGHDHGHDHEHDHDGHQHQRGARVAAPPAARIGDPAPAIRFPTVAGPTVDLAEYRGKRVALLFWNQSCGFCANMVPDLERWDEQRPAGAPELLVISASPPEAHADLTLRSPVLLDQAFSTARAVGANGTPMAVLVDEEGRIASELAAGADAVLQLLGAGSSRPNGGA